MNKPVRTIFVTTFVVLMLIMVMNMVSGPMGFSPKTGPKTYEISEFNAILTRGIEANANKEHPIEPGKNGELVPLSEVVTAKWLQEDIEGDLQGGRTYKVSAYSTNSDAGKALLDLLQRAGVKVSIEKPPMSQSAMMLLAYIAMPVILLLLFYLFIVRPAQAGGNQAMSFGRSRAKRVGESGQKITFDDVAGIEEAKQELFEIVDFLKNTKKYVNLGAKIPKGILLTGPPGVGKTHLARAIAGEAGVPFFHISGSDFVEMFVGVGAARVRDLFETAKAHRPCLIFVDEIDAVGRQRGAGLGGGHDEREQTLNQLLVEMDGFDPNAGVIMIAATNRPDVLDPALLRPGRFDRQLVVDPPDARGREAILKIHSKGKPFDSDVDLEKIAFRTPGFTGADLANVMNEAALLAARRNRLKVSMKDVDDALDRVIAGPERRSRVIDDQEKQVLAYHEAGHAVVTELLKGCDPVYKVTILPRGMSLGSSWSIPEQDKYLTNEQELLDDIVKSLGGREAEDLVFNTVWTGSSSDLDRVTRVARAMICQYGMSKRLGTLVLGRRSSNPFLGRDYYEEQNYSEEVAKLIDEEIHKIVEDSRKRCRELLTTNRDKLDRVAQALLTHETLNREEFLAAMDGRPIPERPATHHEPEPVNEPAATDKPGNPISPPRFEPGPA